MEIEIIKKYRKIIKKMAKGISNHCRYFQN